MRSGCDCTAGPTGPSRSTRSPSWATAIRRTPRSSLTYNYGVDRYDLGTGYGHVALGVPDVAAVCDAVRERAPVLGGKGTREPGPVKGGTSVIAFIEDPDGYKIELIEHGT